MQRWSLFYPPYSDPVEIRDHHLYSEYCLRVLLYARFLKNMPCLGCGRRGERCGCLPRRTRRSMRSQSPTEGVSIELSQQGLQANPTGPISGSGRAQESASRIPGSVSGPVRTQTAVRATTGVVPSLRVSIRPQSLQAAPAAAAAAGTPSSAPDAGSLPLGVETQQWIAGLGRKTQSSASQSILRSIGLATTTIPSVGHSLAADFQHVTNRPAHRLILLNIEADFLIGSKEENYSAPNQREFVTDVARHHNQEVPFHLPRMRVRGPLPDAWYISVTGGDFFMEIPYEGIFRYILAVCPI